MKARKPRKPQDEDVNVTVNVYDDDKDGQKLEHVLARLLHSIYSQGVEILAQIDDLRAAQAATSARVDEVASEVQVLIDRGSANAVDLSDVIASEEAIKAKLDAIPFAP